VLQLDWPSAGHHRVRSVWRTGEGHVSLVEDQLINRDYLLAGDPYGQSALRNLLFHGEVVSPDDLVEAARLSPSYWANLGETLYDLVAGCMDSRRQDVFDIWIGRLCHEHPIIRLAAALAAPYLDGDAVLARLRVTSADDVDARVREAAVVAARVMSRRQEDE
jgi:hypothetical protein